MLGIGGVTVGQGQPSAKSGLIPENENATGFIGMGT